MCETHRGAAGTGAAVGAASHCLRVLVVEDSESDAWLLVRELKKAGFDVKWQRVDSATAMQVALGHAWDVVIADYHIPGFGGLLALEMLRKSGRDVPFIMVSGAIGEETAAAAMKAGASDYLMKDNLARLGPAVEREVREAAMRRMRREAEEARRREMAALREVAQAANEATSIGSALLVMLGVTCRLLGWPLGRGILLGGGSLEDAKCTVLWHAERPRQVPLPPGAAVGSAPGLALAKRTMAAGRAMWVEDLDADAELADMGRSGSRPLRAALAVPVSVGERTAAVLEFFNDRPGAPDPRVVDLFPQLTSQLARVIERQRAEEEIRRLNAALQERIVARTSELTVANKELDILRHSISHELRDPLGRIDGLNQVVIEDYGDRIGDAGKLYLARAREAAQRMGELVDNLLEHSRATRTVLRRETVNLSAIARTVLDEMRRGEPRRNVRAIIPEGLTVRGDRLLLHIALKHLLGNAWKFTGKRPEATIELGQTVRGGETVFFVRDDGVGFDMAYADKLFEPFQRLHSAAEFDGSGLGLATVQQCIGRHRGRVWAESAVGQGATFYFTVPNAEAG